MLLRTKIWVLGCTHWHRAGRSSEHTVRMCLHLCLFPHPSIHLEVLQARTDLQFHLDSTGFILVFPLFIFVPPLPYSKHRAPIIFSIFAYLSTPLRYTNFLIMGLTPLLEAPCTWLPWGWHFLPFLPHGSSCQTNPIAGILKKAPLAQMAVPQQMFRSSFHGGRAISTWHEHGFWRRLFWMGLYNLGVFIVVILLQYFPHYFLLNS